MRGGDVNAQAADGRTALHVAIAARKMYAVRTLCEAEAIDVNIADNNEWYGNCFFVLSFVVVFAVLVVVVVAVVD